MCIFKSNILQLCLYKMKHRDNFWEPVVKQIKTSKNIKFLQKRGVVCKTSVLTKCNLQWIADL